MITQLRRWLPYRHIAPHSTAQTENPLFKWGVRRVRYCHRWQNPTAYGWWLFKWTLGGLVCLGILFALAMMATVFLPNTGYSSRYSLTSLADDYINHIVQYAYYLGIGLGFVLDLLIMGIGLSVLQPLRVVVRSEPFRLTNISASSVVSTYHSIVRLRTWRITVVLVAFRLAVFLMFIIMLAVFDPLTHWELMTLQQMFSLSSDPIEAAFEFANIVMLLGAVAIEPLWRSRMLAAMVTHLLSFSANLVILMISGVFMWVLLVLLPQIVGFGWFLREMGFGPYDSQISYFFALLIVTAILYSSYIVLEGTALYQAHKHILREEGV